MNRAPDETQALLEMLATLDARQDRTEHVTTAHNKAIEHLGEGLNRLSDALVAVAETIKQAQQSPTQQGTPKDTDEGA